MKDKCTFCQGEGYDESISDCCGEKRDEDTMLCYECHDHCGPMECPECHGKGYLLIEWNEEDSPPMECWELY